MPNLLLLGVADTPTRINILMQVKNIHSKKHTQFFGSLSGFQILSLLCLPQRTFTISLITHVFNEVYLKREIFLVWLVLVKVEAWKRGQEK